MRKRSIEAERKHRISKYSKNVIKEIKSITKNLELMFELTEDEKIMLVNRDGSFSIGIDRLEKNDFYSMYYSINFNSTEEIIGFSRNGESNRKGTITTVFNMSDKTKDLIEKSPGAIYVDKQIKFNKLSESIENGLFQSILVSLVDDYDNLEHKETENELEFSKVVSRGGGVGIGMVGHQYQCLWQHGTGKSSLLLDYATMIMKKG